METIRVHMRVLWPTLLSCSHGVSLVPLRTLALVLLSAYIALRLIGEAHACRWAALLRLALPVPGARPRPTCLRLGRGSAVVVEGFC